MRRFLPRFYLEGFLDPEEHVEGSPAVWVHRPVIGVFQPAPVEPRGTSRHFNEVDEPALATWKRRGEVWRHATEDALLELNARTLVRAHRFVLAPKPAIPG